MRNHVSTALCVAVCSLHSAHAGTWNLKPGEAGLDGTVKSVNLKTRSVVMMASTFAMPDGKEISLNPARGKLVLTNDTTGFTGIALQSSRAGYHIRVVGTDHGKGKPLTAMTVNIGRSSRSPAPLKRGQLSSAPLIPIQRVLGKKFEAYDGMLGKPTKINVQAHMGEQRNYKGKGVIEWLSAYQKENANTPGQVQVYFRKGSVKSWQDAVKAVGISPTGGKLSSDTYPDSVNIEDLKYDCWWYAVEPETQQPMLTVNAP